MAVRCDKFNHNGGGCACPEPGAVATGAENTETNLDVPTGPYGPVQIPGAGLDWHAIDADDRWPGQFTSYAVREDDLQLRITPGDNGSYEADGFEWEVGPVSPSVAAPHQSGHADTLADAARDAERAREYVTSGQAEYDALVADDYDYGDLGPLHTTSAQSRMATDALTMAKDAAPGARETHIQAMLLMNQPIENMDVGRDPAFQPTAIAATEFAADRFGPGGSMDRQAGIDDYVDNLSFSPMDEERAQRASDVMTARAIDALHEANWIRRGHTSYDEDQIGRANAKANAAIHWAVAFRGNTRSAGDLRRALDEEIAESSGHPLPPGGRMKRLVSEIWSR